jgi:thioesterase domain-containing protein
MHTETLGKYLEETLRTKIPITKEMGIRVASYDGYTLLLQAPLERNVNDKGTAFGGSLFSLAVLAGWGLIFLKLKEENLSGDIVIHESTISYHLPVTGILAARCSIPEGEEYADFIERLRSRGRGKISLETILSRDSRVAVKFSGRYVVKILKGQLTAPIA